MKRLLTVLLALVLAIAVAMPVMAAPIEVPTSVNINSGSTANPIVKCKWEQDLTVSLEDGDPTHKTPGTQLLPPLVKGGKKYLEYWAVVTDPDGVGTIAGVLVKVYHPEGPPLFGSFKYQLMLTKVDLVTGLAAYKAARDAKLVTYQTTPAINDADILFEIDKGTCAIYKVQGELDYEQPAGDYKAAFDCFDNGNTWASPASALSNLFTYVAVPAIEIDFNSFSYGGVTVCNEKWIAGNTIWDAVMGAAPSPNPATVRSIGNVLVYVTVKNNPMGFLYNGVAPTTYAGPVAPTGTQSNWKVVFDARMGSTATNAMYYDPDVTVQLPNKLALSSQDELDFSIHVKEAMPGLMTGAMFIGCVTAPW